MHCEFHTLNLIRTVVIDDTDKYFSEDVELLYLGNGKTLVMSREEGWSLIDQKKEQAESLTEGEESHSHVNPGECFHDTDIILNDEQCEIINSYIDCEDLERNEVKEVNIIKRDVDVVKTGTLIDDTDPRSLQVTAWALHYHAMCIVRYRETPAEFFSSDDLLTSLPSIWSVSINNKEVREFISFKKPYVVFDTDLWYIYVQRHDCGFDIYRLKPASSL